MIYIEELKSIKYYFSILWGRLVLRLLWKNLKPQELYVDANKYHFASVGKVVKLLDLYLNLEIWTYKGIELISIEDLTTSGNKNVIFLRYT